jgi:hypothetical protein
VSESKEIEIVIMFITQKNQAISCAQKVAPLAVALATLGSIGMSAPVQAQQPAPGASNQKSAQTAPFINTWLISGLFDNAADNAGYERDWIGEAQAQPKEGAAAGGSSWKYFDDRLFSRNYDDYQDLFSYFKVKQGLSVASKVAYAHVYVYSPVAQGAQLRIGADNSFKAWINGAQVAASTNSSPMKGSESAWVADDPATLKNSGKDYVSTDVQLAAGWNRLLLKVANQQNGRFGFYARFTDANAGEIPGLVYSTGGSEGALTISTNAMPEAKTGNLPVGFREWSYVGAHPDVEAVENVVNSESVPFKGYVKNRDLLMGASDFQLTAQGGALPYRWTLAGGGLPDGLKLDADGGIRGTVAVTAKLGEYPLKVRVRDSQGTVAEKTLSLTVRERPNKWYEEGRLGALIHGPERTPPNQVKDVARMMKRQGYKLGLPITYNNGDMLFRWDSPFASPDKKTADDWVIRYKNALEAEGITFGMYMGNLNAPSDPNFNVNQQVLMVEEAMVKYKPKALWFDWLGIDATSVDSLYSMIKSYDPETIVILNGHLRLSSGDWDVIDFEAWQSWGKNIWRIWPANFPWPKKHTPESWRVLVQPDFVMSPGIETDWQEMLKVQLSLIGEGYIANIDHTPYLGVYDGEKSKIEKLSDSPLMQMHEKMANWASPAGLPPLYPSYTSVNPGPLQDDFWGYNTINVKRDTIYLHLIENPQGKKGMPADKSLTISPLQAKVKSVTWMNKNKPLLFLQRGTSTDRTVTIELGGIQRDPIDTIIEIKLEKPLPEPSATVAAPQIPAGNFATKKPAKLLSTDGLRNLDPSGSQYAKNGVDGDMETTAAGAWEYAWMYHVDLEQVRSLSRIVVNLSKSGYATAYKVMISDDGEEWKTVADVKDNKAGGAFTHTFAPTDARYIRVQAVTPDGPDQPGGQMSITELQAFEK